MSWAILLLRHDRNVLHGRVVLCLGLEFRSCKFKVNSKFQNCRIFKLRVSFFFTYLSWSFWIPPYYSYLFLNLNILLLIWIINTIFKKIFSTIIFTLRFHGCEYAPYSLKARFNVTQLEKVHFIKLIKLILTQVELF